MAMSPELKLSGFPEVVVTARRPIAESAAALQVQRASDSLVSVLSADAVGNLPDQNVAFAVGRLPGVGVQRDQGQARYVNLRGAPVYWTNLSFDGLSVVSPQGRDSRFDNIPSAIASQIMVQKAIVPSMPGDTVAGNIDIRTRRAFDYPGSNTTGKLGYGYVTKGGGKEIDSSFVTSNVFMDGKLGVVAQASYYQRQMATDNWETDPYLGNSLQLDETTPRLAALLDEVRIKLDFAPRPKPMPTAEQRRVGISVTDFDQLKSDPYSFYAKRVLRLRPMEPVDAEPDHKWRGILVHDILEKWFRDDKCAPEKLIARAEDLLTNGALDPILRTLWQPRIADGLRWIAEQTQKLRDEDGRRTFMIGDAAWSSGAVRDNAQLNAFVA